MIDAVLWTLSKTRRRNYPQCVGCKSSDRRCPVDPGNKRRRKYPQCVGSKLNDRRCPLDPFEDEEAELPTVRGLQIE